MRRPELKPLAPGTPAPDFTLPRSSYASVSLGDVRGRCAILVFYPADWEPVSQQQLTLYQDHLAEFSERGAALLAVSTDHVWSHGAFARALGITYPLLADAHPNGAVCRAYGVYDEGAGLSARALVALDGSGIVRWSRIYPTAVNPGVGDIITELDFLASYPPDSSSATFP